MKSIQVSSKTYSLIEQLSNFGDRNEDEVISRELSIRVAERFGNAVTPEITPTTVMTQRTRKPSRADEVRRSYAEGVRAKGVNLTLESGIWGRVDDKAIALPFSSELSQGKWWLGVLHREVESRKPILALLCQAEDGRVFDIVLPAVWFDGVRQQMTVASNGQYMIDVDHVEGRFYLRIPRSQPIDVTDRLGNWA